MRWFLLPDTVFLPVSVPIGPVPVVHRLDPETLQVCGFWLLVAFVAYLLVRQPTPPRPA